VRVGDNNLHCVCSTIRRAIGVNKEESKLRWNNGVKFGEAHCLPEKQNVAANFKYPSLSYSSDIKHVPNLHWHHNNPSVQALSGAFFENLKCRKNSLTLR
jgi:hypothetical protein